MGRLFWKILIGLWLTLIAVSVAVGFVLALYNESRAPAPEELASGPRIALMTGAAANALEYGGTPALQGLLDDWPRFTQERLFAVDETGRDALGRTVPTAPLNRARTLAASGNASERDGDPRRRPVVRTTATPDGQRYIVFIAAADSVASDRRGSGRPNRPGTVAGVPYSLLLMGGLAGLVFAALLAWYIARPIRVLRRAFGQLAQGDLNTRVTPDMGHRRDELADLGRDFDHMAGRLGQLVSAQRQLLHDVSHELRSPLARLQVAIGLARKNAPTPDTATAAAFDRIERESGRLDMLVGELLTLSRLEARGEEDWDEYFDMLELTDAVIADASFEADNAGIELRYTQTGFASDAPEALVRGRAELLHRALENIVRNALKYSQRGQTVSVALTHADDKVTVVVSDQGPGVPAEQLEMMFEPFVRLHNTGMATGYGLGLAIAQRAVMAHRGTIAAANRPEGGLAVTMALPVTATATAS